MAIATFEEIRQKKKVPSFKELRSEFDPEGSGYDYATARAHELEPDETGHWPSRVPQTGQILKGQKHPTYNLTVEGEKQAGFEIYKKDGRYYSRPTQVPSFEEVRQEPAAELERAKIGPWEPSLWERVKTKLTTQPPPGGWDRTDRPFRTLGQAALYGLGKYGTGRALYTPKLVDKEIAKKISGFDPTVKEESIGDFLEFVGGLRSAGQILGPLIGTLPTVSGQAIIGGAGIFGLRNILEQLIDWATTGKPPSLEAFEKDTALGALFGTAEAGLIKFVGFVRGLKGLSKAKLRPARAEVDKAIKHFKKTGDRSLWDEVRIKYAGIEPEAAARIRARAKPAPPVKEFGKHPLAKAKPAPTAAEITPTIAPEAKRAIIKAKPPKVAPADYLGFQKDIALEIQRVHKLSAQARGRGKRSRANINWRKYAEKHRIPEEAAEEITVAGIGGRLEGLEGINKSVESAVKKYLAPKVAPVAEGKGIALTDKEVHELMRESLDKNQYTMYLQDEVQARTRGDQEAATRAFDEEANVLFDRGYLYDQNNKEWVRVSAKEKARIEKLAEEKPLAPVAEGKVEQLKKQGYTQKQAEFIQRNREDMIDRKSPTVQEVLNNPQNYPVLGETGKIAIFRVSEKGGELTPGKFVFTSKIEAKAFREEFGFKRGQPEIIEQTVDKTDLRKTEDAGELIFFPKALVQPPTPSALERKPAAETKDEYRARTKEVKAKVPEGEISRQPVTVEGKKYYPVSLPVEKISVDAERFQFKLGAKLVGGVTEALKDVERFDPVKGGQIFVWQDKAGKYWVVDGHHRVALAKKTGAESLETWVVSEKDGVTEQDARAIGALRNLADGKGTAVDAAKLFRDSNISLEELRKNAVPTNSTVVQQGLDMADLSDEVFRLVVDERLPANMAAAIGKQVKNPAQQKQVADLILEGEVETLRQAELLAATIDSAPVLTKTEQTLFGLETTEKSLYAERAKVLANVEKKLKTNKKVFGVLATQTGIIEAKGNILAKVENLATKEKAEEVLFMLEKLANSKGPVAEALNDATKQYAENPTKENLSKVTTELLEKWTEGPGRLRIPERKGVPELPLERAAEKVAIPTFEEIRKPPAKAPVAKPKPKGKPGFIDVRPLAKVHESIMNIIEPSKAVEIAQGKEAYATVIKGIHKADVGRIEFNEADIDSLDRSLQEFGELLSKYSKATLTNLMAARGKPAGKGAILLKNEALKKLAKEAPELIGVRRMITRIADFNYKYLQNVVGDDIHYVEDYFYGIYKDAKRVERFLDHWKTTKRFTKEKKLPTVADALDYGLELRDPNPVNNLRSEYMAIARLDGMIYMRDELLRTGKGKYIDTKEDAPIEWEKVKDPVFKDHRVAPELALLINKLISTNQLRRHPVLNAIRKVNNFLRTVKFMGSAFHQLSIAKQSIADEGYLEFIQPSATRGVTLGFRKSDPIFKTQGYKDYIEHGGGHRYSIASQAQRAFTNFIESLDKRLGILFKVGGLPIRIPKSYVKWLFQSYIPKVKYAKYADRVVEKEEELGRQLTSPEKIDIIKEQQNFYGMMNERLFGRSSTATTVLRLWFMAPGYAEGNYRTILKSILQWGGKDGYKASRSRSNIINSLLLSAVAATAGTLILTGKPPKVPETREDVRDLFKVDTGMVDDKGRKIMIDLLTYDKDYWNIVGQTLIGYPDKALVAAIKRTGGMVAPTAKMVHDLAALAQGKAIYDWKGDRVTEITDPFARQVLKIVIHEIKRIEPISVSVFKQSRRRDQTRVLSFLTSLLGYRPTKTEKDKREQQVLHRIYSLKGQQEELYQYLASIRNPRKAVERYNKTVNGILSSPMIPQSMRKEWEPKLLIDLDRYLENRVYYLSGQNRTPREIERAKKILENFGVTPAQAQEHLKRYWQREGRKVPVSPLERDRVIGRTRKRQRLQERLEK